MKEQPTSSRVRAKVQKFTVMSGDWLRSESSKSSRLKTINCKELIEKERKHSSSLLYSSRRPSSQHAFVEGPDRSVSGAAEANVGVQHIKGQHTHTEEHA